jgi:hypothetical protein
MGMTQLVIGTACGFLAAQALLYGISRLGGWLRHGHLAGLLMRARAMRATPGPSLLGAFIKYAAPVGIGAALITLAVWAASDYFAAKSARNAEANLFDSSASAPAAEQDSAPVRSATLTPAPAPAVAEAPVSSAADPYADPEFRVQHKAHRSGATQSLKETLVRQSETRARNELLRELQQHIQRSQYDCEAADRADRYLKAGLDVWGFATWQVKYFPQSNYRGATLEQCRDIKNVVASSVDLQSAIAQQGAADSDR